MSTQGKISLQFVCIRQADVQGARAFLFIFVLNTCAQSEKASVQKLFICSVKNKSIMSLCAILL